MIQKNTVRLAPLFVATLLVVGGKFMISGPANSAASFEPHAVVTNQAGTGEITGKSTGNGSAPQWYHGPEQPWAVQSRRS